MAVASGSEDFNRSFHVDEDGPDPSAGECRKYNKYNHRVANLKVATFATFKHISYPFDGLHERWIR